MQINKPDIQQWINALRSGNYSQTKFYLQNNIGYCCLGLACQLFIPQNQIEYNSLGYIIGQLPSRQHNAPKWLKGINADFMCKTGEFLSKLNDKGWTFNQIADALETVYINEQLLTL